MKAQVVAKGQFSDLLFGDGWLYSLQSAQPGPGDRVVRLSRVSGHVVARSAVLPSASWPTFVDNALWLTVWLPKVGSLVVLTMTLRQERSMPESISLDSLTGFGHGPLWAALGCKLERLDPSSARVMQVVNVRGGTECEIVMDNETDRLFVEVGPYTNRGKPPTPTLSLQERNGGNGRLLGSAIIPNPPFGWDSMSAADGNVWLSGGDPGLRRHLLLPAGPGRSDCAAPSTTTGRPGRSDCSRPPTGQSAPTFLRESMEDLALRFPTPVRPRSSTSPAAWPGWQVPQVSIASTLGQRALRHSLSQCL